MPSLQIIHRKSHTQCLAIVSWVCREVTDSDESILPGSDKSFSLTLYDEGAAGHKRLQPVPAGHTGMV